MLCTANQYARWKARTRCASPLTIKEFNRYCSAIIQFSLNTQYYR